MPEEVPQAVAACGGGGYGRDRHAPKGPKNLKGRRPPLGRENTRFIARTHLPVSAVPTSAPAPPWP